MRTNYTTRRYNPPDRNGMALHQQPGLRDAERHDHEFTQKSRQEFFPRWTPCGDYADVGPVLSASAVRTHTAGGICTRPLGGNRSAWKHVSKFNGLLQIDRTLFAQYASHHARRV